MRVLVFKAKNLLLACTIFVLSVAIIAVLAYTWSAGSIGVFKADKDLPIYSVDVPEKKVAITFDCAWEEVR